MSRKLTLVLILPCLLLGLHTQLAWGQAGSQGTVAVTVLDQSGSVVPMAQLTLVDLSTNTVREATTLDSGNFTFVNLNIGNYKLTVSKTGFSTQAYSVDVQAGRTTGVKASLKVGTTTAVVEVVGSASPLVETSSSAVSMTITTEQIENLPLSGRDISALSRMSAGYNGTWNGLPTMAQGSNIDGVMGASGRWKYQSSGGAASAVTPRLENIAEMTVQTDQLDMNQGFGNSNMQINYVTRRGTNNFHGRFYEDFRNAALNANYWSNRKDPVTGKTPKSQLILNEFGGSLGGRVIKDKLFFFGSFSMSKQPGGYNATNLFITPAAQSGTFTYSGGTRNLFDIVRAYNTANGASLPTTLNATTAAAFQKINASLSKGSLRPDLANSPNLGGLQWNQSNPVTNYYPTFRVDYNVTQSVRLNLSYNQTKWNSPGKDQGFFPEDGRAGGRKGNNVAAAFGLEWAISPTLINQLKGGYLYNANWYGQNGPTDFYDGAPIINWNYAFVDQVDWYYLGWMSGQNYQLPNSRFQPIFNMSDTLSWMKGKHSLSMGFSWYREQDHYWDPPEGYPVYNLGLAGGNPGDPALQAITAASLPGISDSELQEAQQLYAILTGRLASVTARKAYDAQTGEYTSGVRGATLNELQKAWGLFFQDSYKLKPNFTLNYGLRWDFTGDNYDLTNAYHSAGYDVFGPSGYWNLFNPGSLKGSAVPLLTSMPHVYQAWNVTPQPAIGISWNPRKSGGWLERLLGGDSTVVRAGYALRRYTEPQQYYWNAASDYGAFFYQNLNLNANSTGKVGTFTPGSLVLGSSLPVFAYSPTKYVSSQPQADFTFGGGTGVNGMDPYIRQPYTQSWNIGIQRQLGATRALEIRYNANHTIHQWVMQNINEVNIFENGFLQEFKNAKNNLDINLKNEVNSFANLGRTGQVPLPILTAAFGASGAGFTNETFIQNLKLGQAGAMANALTSVGYFCNLVGDSFTPCKNYGFTGAGAGYPINFFQANPYASGTDVGYMTDSGFSNYHSLQVEFRQRPWHGLQFNANYTWSHTLGVAEALDWEAKLRWYSNRNLRLNYGPSNFDLRQVFNLNASYDLPLGRGKKWLNQGGIVDKVMGGWTFSTIYRIQSGTPFRVTGNNPYDSTGTSTYSQMADSGVVLNGVTVSDLQSHVGVFKLNTGAVRIIDPNWLKDSMVTANTTPGTIGQIIYLHGPRQWFDDIAITKSVSFTERVKFKFQAEMLNAFNHPIFGVSGGNYQQAGGGLGRGTYVNDNWMYSRSSRRIEFRANLEF